jgi:hypothetical protein
MSATEAIEAPERKRMHKVLLPECLVSRVRELAEREGSSTVAPMVRRLIAVGLRAELSRWQSAARAAGDR